MKHCYIFESNQEGPTVSIFAGIHGDEISGIQAAEGIVDLINRNKIKLKKGKLIIVTRGNEEAIEAKKRYVKHNMNRLFKKDILDNNSADYEIQRAKELTKLLIDMKVDYHLDLHSVSNKSTPFMFAELENLAFAKKLGVGKIIAGWNAMGDVVGGDTECFVNSMGGLGFTFEAGNHNDLKCEYNSFQVCENFLTILDLINDGKNNPLEDKTDIYNITGMYVAKTENFKYIIKNVENFLEVSKGTPIGEDGDFIYKANEDITLLMPIKEDVIKKGEEAFFIGLKN